MLFGITGSSNATTDSAIGQSGKPTRVYAAAMRVTGTVPGVFQLRNGTTTADTILIEQSNDRGDGVPASTVISFGENGVLFSAGCFYDHGTSNAAVTFTHRTEK